MAADPVGEGAEVKVPGALCGLMCLYAYARLHGMDFDLRSVTTSEFVGADGSTLSQLVSSAERQGLYAEPMKKMGLSFLRNTPYGVVLHVKKDPLSLEYDHYVLFLGIEGNNARILDLPNRAEYVPLQSLASSWDVCLANIHPE